MKQKKYTKKQHYVPQVYFKGFSDDLIKIWSFPIDALDKGAYVPIESVCRENYLYEFKDNNENLILPNRIEIVLSQLERLFYEYRGKLIEKTAIEQNYNTKCFLSYQEKEFWKLYIAVQILRDPILLDTVSLFAKECWGDALTENQRKGFALNQCLPFLNEIKAEDKIVFNAMLQTLNEMSFLVGVDEKNSIFTSDSPVFMCSQAGETPRIEKIEQIIIPITSGLAFILFGGTNKKLYRNRLYKLDEEALKHIKYSIAYAANNRLFSRKKLSSIDIGVIERARKDKERDIL